MEDAREASGMFSLQNDGHFVAQFPLVMHMVFAQCACHFKQWEYILVYLVDSKVFSFSSISL